MQQLRHVLPALVLLAAAFLHVAAAASETVRLPGGASFQFPPVVDPASFVVLPLDPSCTYRTRYGVPCVELPVLYKESYYTCKTSASGDWEYCSPGPNRTISVWSDHCLSECSQNLGTTYKYYYWCTCPGGTWDYCSPTDKKTSLKDLKSSR